MLCVCLQRTVLLAGCYWANRANTFALLILSLKDCSAALANRRKIETCRQALVGAGMVLSSLGRHASNQQQHPVHSSRFIDSSYLPYSEDRDMDLALLYSGWRRMIRCHRRKERSSQAYYS